MPLNGNQEQRLRDAVLEGFTKQELVELMRFNLDVTLANKIDINKPFSANVFDLLEWLDHEGEERLQRFIETIYRVRKGKAEVVAICIELAPYLQGDAAAAIGVSEHGIQAVTNAARQNEALKLQLMGTRGDLQLTAQGIATLTNLKKIHDQLHNLEMRLYRELRRTARNFRDKPNGAEEEFELGIAVSDLTSILTRIHERAEKLTPLIRPGVDPWLDTMDTAHNSIIRILDKKEQGDPLHQVNGLLLDGLVGLSPFMHAMMFQEAARLPLTAVISAFENVVPTVTEARPADGVLITQAVAGLRNINALLHDEVQEHSFWQKVNIKLHLLEKGIGRLETGDAAAARDVEDVMAPTLTDVKAYCSIRKTDNWSINVDRLVDVLDQAWDAPDKATTAIERAFQTLQKQIGERFKDVDDHLLGLCEQMSGLDGPLAELRNVF